jgi:hypothetical protein
MVADHFNDLWTIKKYFKLLTEYLNKQSMIIIFHGVREGRVRCQMILTHRCYIKQVYMPI